MDKKGIIFTDLDGTLIFHEKAHGIEKIAEMENGLVRVRDPSSNSEHIAHDVSTQYYNVYFSCDTRSIAKELEQHYHIIFVTGARTSTMGQRLPTLDFASGYILENGSIIRDKDFKIDQEWAVRIAPELPYLKQVQRQLEHEGWKLDIAGRIAMLRIRSKDNPHKNIKAFYDLQEHLELPEQLKKTTNLANLDILPRSSGKDNAARYIMNKLGYSRSQTIGIGDDFNDIELLQITGKQYVPLSAYNEMIAAASASGWYISHGFHFNAANEIMAKILKEAQ